MDLARVRPHVTFCTKFKSVVEPNIARTYLSAGALCLTLWKQDSLMAATAPVSGEFVPYYCACCPSEFFTWLTSH